MQRPASAIDAPPATPAISKIVELHLDGEVEPLLDALCAAFAERSLRELSSEGVIDCEQLLASGRIHAYSLPLLRGLLQMLCDDGV